MKNLVRHIGLGIATASSIAAIGSGANAQAVPAASYFEQSFPNGPNGSNAASSSSAGSVSSATDNQDGHASGAATATSRYVSADAFSDSASNEGLANASETYYFSVVGSLDEAVPLLVSGGGSLYSTGGSGWVEVVENSNNYTGFYQSCSSGSPSCGDFSYSHSMQVQSNAIAFIKLGIYAVVQGGSNGGWIDPTITIDPTFQDASAFHLEFSDGITNGDAAPEPASWACMTIGFGAIGVAARRRRRVTARA